MPFIQIKPLLGLLAFSMLALASSQAEPINDQLDSAQPLTLEAQNIVTQMAATHNSISLDRFLNAQPKEEVMKLILTMFLQTQENPYARRGLVGAMNTQFGQRGGILGRRQLLLLTQACLFTVKYPTERVGIGRFVYDDVWAQHEFVDNIAYMVGVYPPTKAVIYEGYTPKEWLTQLFDAALQQHPSPALATQIHTCQDLLTQ